MQLLTEVIDINELYRLRILFESKGIAVFISNEDSARNFGFIYPARKYGIFIVYDVQYRDALALLDNEEHEVETPIDLDEYNAFIESQKADTGRKFFKTMMKVIAVGLLAIVGITFMLIKLMS